MRYSKSGSAAGALFIGHFFMCLSSAASAQSVDVGQIVAGLVAAHGPEPVTDTIWTPTPHTTCRPPPIQQALLGADPICNTTTDNVASQQQRSALLTASNIQIVKVSDFVWDKPVITNIPNDVEVAQNRFRNCGDVSEQDSVNLTEQVQHSESYTIQHTVADVEGHTIGVNTGFKADGFDVGVSASFNFSHTDTTATILATGTVISDSRAYIGTLTVPPHAYYLAELETYQVLLSAGFQAIVTIDADLSANDKGLSKLSQIVDGSKLMFPLDGTIQSRFSSVGIYNVYVVSGDISAECALPGGDNSPQAAAPIEQRTLLTSVSIR